MTARELVTDNNKQNLFGFISLQTGAELITLALILNKVTGVYGLLAILTGYQLSLLQLLTYVYSIAVLASLVYLAPHIRRQSAVECLALAWLYVVDTGVNAVDTVAFGTQWYPATGTTASAGVPPQETAFSILLIVAHTLLRVYLSLVVMAFARQTIRATVQRLVILGEGDVVDAFDGPFTVGLPDGEGRRGAIGRAMVSVVRGYWLEKPEDGWQAATGWVPEESSKAKGFAKPGDF